MSFHDPRSRCASIAFLAVVMFTGCADTTAPPSQASTTDAGTISDASHDDHASVESDAESETKHANTSDAENADSLESIPQDIFVAESHTSSQLNEIGGKQNLILEYPADDIAGFIEIYHNGMKEQGWTLVTSSELPIGTIANFSKDERKCTLSIAPPKDGIIKVAILIPQK